MTIVYGFVNTIRDEHPVEQICKVLGINRSCFYEWHNKTTHQPKAKNTMIEQKVIAVFSEHKRRYGFRRIVAELKHQNVWVSPYKVRKYLSANELKAIQPRSFVPKTTNSRHPYQISPNHLKTKAFPVAINQVWVGDITYIPMAAGVFRYLSVWMDLCSRKIVGWDLQDHMQESLVTASLNKAIRTRKVSPGLMIHSDRGGQYAGTKFRQMLHRRTVIQSMSDADNPYDNAHIESLFSRFKAELMEGGAFHDAEDSQTEIFDYIEMYYNPLRLHSSIGYLSPNNFENQLALT
ncbi:MAG: IS3 family transposase [Chitinophagaceae bacterium]